MIKVVLFVFMIKPGLQVSRTDPVNCVVWRCTYLKHVQPCRKISKNSFQKMVLRSVAKRRISGESQNIFLDTPKKFTSFLFTNFLD